MPFKTGAVRMAQETDSYIIPFSITGKYKLLRKSVKICFDKPYKISGSIDAENQRLEKKVSNLIRRNS